MRLSDYLYLSCKYIKSHLARFIVSVITFTLLLTILSGVVCAYASGKNSFKNGVADTYAQKGLSVSFAAKNNAVSHQALNNFLSANFKGNYYLNDKIDLRVTKTIVHKYEYPYSLKYFATDSTIDRTIIEGEQFNPSDCIDKIWIPQITNFDLPLTVGSELPLTIIISDVEYNINPTIAGIHAGNEVYLGLNYIFQSNIAVNAPSVILLPESLTYDEISEKKTLLQQAAVDIYGNNALLFSDRYYFEDYNKAKEKNLILLLISTLVLVSVIFVSLSNSLMLSISDNSKSLCLMKTLGLKNKYLFFILCFEAILIIAISSLVSFGIVAAFQSATTFLGNWMWGSTLIMFGSYTIAPTLLWYLPFLSMALLSLISIITTYFNFKRSGKKYVNAILKENYL